MKSYKLLSHTADIRLKVEGDTLPELFSAALLGMSGILKPDFCQKSAESRRAHFPLVCEISISSPDATALLVDFLSEALTFSCEKKAVFCQVEFAEITDNSLRAKIYGGKVNKFDEDIKAVTYHEAEIKKNKKGNLETVIVFDI